MDRTVATQVVAMLVVLAILVRWIPVADSSGDLLGRGAPLVALQLDAYLQELEQRNPQAPRAFMRGYGKRNPDHWKSYFIRRLREADRIRERYAADPSVFIQFKGVPRNEMWLLMYDFYPVPMIGTWLEDGSRENDPTEPGATVVETRLERPTEQGEPQRTESARPERRTGGTERRR